MQTPSALVQRKNELSVYQKGTRKKDKKGLLRVSELDLSLERNNNFRKKQIWNLCNLQVINKLRNYPFLQGDAGYCFLGYLILE